MSRQMTAGVGCDDHHTPYVILGEHSLASIPPSADIVLVFQQKFPDGKAVMAC